MRNVLGPWRRCNVCDPRRRCNWWGRLDVCRTAGAGARHVSGSTRQLHAPKACSAQERTTLAMSSADGSWYGVTVRLYLPARRAPPSAGADVAGVSPVPVQMWAGGARSWCRCGRGRAQSRCRCGGGEPSPGADVAPGPVADAAGASPVRVQMWRGRARPGADVAEASPVPVQMWAGGARSQCECGRGEPSPGADEAGAGPVEGWCRSGTGAPSIHCYGWGLVLRAPAVVSMNWTPSVSSLRRHGPIGAGAADNAVIPSRARTNTAAPVYSFEAAERARTDW